MIDALARCEITAGRLEGLTGVWIDRRKIASLGVGIRRWTTLHGFAVNVATDLGRFDAIVPCGIEGCVMTSIAAEAGRKSRSTRLRTSCRSDSQRCSVTIN